MEPQAAVKQPQIFTDCKCRNGRDNANCAKLAKFRRGIAARRAAGGAAYLRKHSFKRR